MRLFSVHYRHDYDSIFDSPYIFVCLAESEDHAKEQCQNAYEHCEIIQVTQGKQEDSET